MKQNKQQYQPMSVEWKNNFEFLRKGINGDGLSYLNESQKNQIMNIFIELYPNGYPKWLTNLEYI